MERLNGYVMRAHTVWLASSITCCFPRSQDEPEHLLEKDVDPESGTSSRRQSPVPLSKYNTKATVTCQPSESQQIAPPRLHQRTNSHIVEEHNAYQDLRRISKRTSAPQWFKEGQDLASSATAKARRMSRHSTAEDPATSIRKSLSRRRRRKPEEPAEPQRVCISPIQHVAPFRPLQLSIYLPGFELPELPKFSDDANENDSVPPVPAIPRPPQAVMRAKSEAMLATPTSDSAPRVPFLSTQSSLEFGRPSTDSEMTMVEPTFRPRTSSLSYGRSRRPSNATTRSNQEFMELINAPLPALPKIPLRQVETKSEETHPTIVRSASDQSKRLQAHLQEREQVQADIGSPDCSTIAEERSPTTSPRPNRHRSLSAPSRASVSSPPPQGLAIIDAVSSEAGILTTTQVTQIHDFAPPAASLPCKPEDEHTSTNRDSTSLNRALSAPSRSSQDNVFPRSSASSATLLNRSASTGTPDITARLQSITTNDTFVKPTVTTTVTALNEKPSMTTVSQRLTQWLSRSKSLSKETLRSTSATPDHLLRSESKADLEIVAHHVAPVKIDVNPMTSTPLPKPAADETVRPSIEDTKSHSEPELSFFMPQTLADQLNARKSTISVSADDRSEKSWFDNRNSHLLDPASEDAKAGSAEKWIVGSGGGIVRQRSGTESTYVEKGVFGGNLPKAFGEETFRYGSGPDVNEVSAVGLAM